MSLESRQSVREAAITALCAPELASIVDVVTWVEDVEGVPTAHAANHHGRVRLVPGGGMRVLAGHALRRTHHLFLLLLHSGHLQSGRHR